MDLKKLKIDKFNKYSLINFPPEYSPNLETVDENIEVILYYIDSIDDVINFVKYCDSAVLSKENHVIMVYEKERKDGVNRDSIFMSFKKGEYSGYKMKAPMLCSVSDKLSAFVQQKEI